MENMPTGLTTTTFNQGGTLAYESPELIMQSSHRTLESDVWAWGCLLQEIHTGKPPYYWANNPGAIVKWITTDIPPAILEDLGIILTHLHVAGDLSQLPATSDRLERIMVSGERQRDILVVDNSSQRMKLMRSELGLRKGEILGSGACGTVYRGTMTKLGTDNAVEVAIKGVCIVDEDDDAKRQRLFNDLRDASADWAGLRNPNILPFLGLCIDSYGDPEILLVSPFVVGGNLSDYLKGQSLGDAKKIDMWNILINEKGGVVLSDYGFAQVMNKAGVKTKVTGDVEMSSRYWSPEVRAGAVPSARDDVWSWSCVLLEASWSYHGYGIITDQGRQIVTGRVPYDGVEDAPAVVDELACPPRVQNLLGLCWKKDQTLRPAISEVLAILDGKPFRYENVHSINANSVECLKLSRDGTKLAVAYKDCVEVYSTRDGKQLLYGFVIVTGVVPELTTIVWNIDEGKGVRRFSDSDNRLNDVDVSSDGAWAASVPSGRTVHLTHLAGNSGRDRTLATVKGTYSVAFSPAANILAAGLAGGGLQIFNVDTGESLAVLGGTAIACSLSFSSDGRWLFEGGDEGLLKWDTSRLAKLTPEARLYDGSVYHVAISPDNNTVAFLDPESAVRIRIGQVLVVPTASNVEIGRVPSHSIDHQDVAVSNGGSGVAVGWTRGTKEVRVYHYSSYGSPGTYRIDRLGSEDLDAEEVAVYNQRRRTFSIESSPRSLPRFGGGENVEGSEMGEAVDGVESGSLLFYE
ncbi:hypothetical protein FRB99_005941 [Tulasnella sp. 403]|nr:hypothetical protein FRB99_005941 [Tulasnella sp. 403]